MLSKIDSQSEKKPGLLSKIIVFITTMVAHFISALFTGFIIYTAWPGSSLFSWHPALMSFAFLFLLFEGILVFSPQSSLVSSMSRKSKLTAHWLFQVSALVCALGGFFVIWYRKYLRDKYHFTSWHGLIGVITIGYLCVQMLGGVMGKYPQILKNFKINIKLADLKMAHATSGLLAYLLVCVSFMLGMFSNWFTANVTGTTWFGCFGCMSCLSLIIMNQIVSAYLPRSKSVK